LLHNSKRSRLCGLVRRLTKFSLTPAHHSVQNHAREPPCNALIFNPPSSQIWAEKGFKPTHGILHQALTSTGYAPGISALLLNLTKIGIPDGERLRGITPLSLRVSPRGNRGCRSALANGFIAGLGVVGPISEDLTHLTGNLHQQRRKHQAVMNVACGTLNSYNFFRVFIDSQMKCAPDPSSTASMLMDVPLPCSVDTKTGGINDNVTRPTAG